LWIVDERRGDCDVSDEQGDESQLVSPEKANVSGEKLRERLVIIRTGRRERTATKTKDRTAIADSEKEKRKECG
jgi:hypothetical protein